MRADFFKLPRPLTREKIVDNAFHRHRCQSDKVPPEVVSRTPAAREKTMHILPQPTRCSPQPPPHSAVSDTRRQSVRPRRSRSSRCGAPPTPKSATLLPRPRPSLARSSRPAALRSARAPGSSAAGNEYRVPGMPQGGMLRPGVDDHLRSPPVWGVSPYWDSTRQAGR